MRTVQARLATTRLDQHGEQAGVEALQGMVDALNAHYIPFGVDHDPRIPPVGRIASATLEPFQGDHFAIVGTLELWDDGDTSDQLIGDGRSPPPPTQPAAVFEVLYDRPGIQELGIEPFADLARLAGESVRPKYHAKKAAEPLSTVLIVCGSFASGAIAGGFFNALGADIYAAFKEKLGKLFKPRKSGERLLALHFGVRTGERVVSADLIASDPSEPAVALLLAGGLSEFDRVVEETLRSHPRAAKVVCHWERGKVELLYWVRDDGVPSVLRPIDLKRLESGGLSMGGPAEFDDRDT
jgi:hypothetical protein